MNSSFHERSIWIQLLSLIGVLGYYFIAAWRMWESGETQIGAYVPLFISTVVLLVVVQVVAHIAAALISRPETPDERDRLIGWRAASRSAWILAVGTLSAITLMVMGVELFWIAHLLLLAMLLAETTKLTLQLTDYRAGL
ncbi:MAG: hypothetical protein KDI71_04955 [Xanthomonadales bacterium]|nr:hypothetical protein [Xanthomonadales bacterium]